MTEPYKVYSKRQGRGRHPPWPLSASVGGWTGRGLSRAGGSHTEDEVAADRRRRQEMISLFAPIPDGLESSWWRNMRRHIEIELERGYPKPGSFTEDEFHDWKHGFVSAQARRLLDNTSRWVGLQPLNEMLQTGTLTADQVRTIVDDVEAFRKDLQRKFFSGDTTATDANRTLAIYLKERVRAAQQRDANRALAISLNERPADPRMDALTLENALQSKIAERKARVVQPSQTDSSAGRKLTPLSLDQLMKSSLTTRRGLMHEDDDADEESTPEPTMTQRQPVKTATANATNATKRPAEQPKFAPAMNDLFTMMQQKTNHTLVRPPAAATHPAVGAVSPSELALSDWNDRQGSIAAGVGHGMPFPHPVLIRFRRPFLRMRRPVPPSPHPAWQFV